MHLPRYKNDGTLSCSTMTTEWPGDGPNDIMSVRRTAGARVSCYHRTLQHPSHLKVEGLAVRRIGGLVSEAHAFKNDCPNIECKVEDTVVHKRCGQNRVTTLMPNTISIKFAVTLMLINSTLIAAFYYVYFC